MAAPPLRLMWLVSASDPSAKFGPFDLEQMQAGRVLLRCGPGGAPSGNLRVTERGDVKPNGARGKWAQFYLLPDLLALAPAGASGKGGGGATHPLFSELVTLASFGNVDKGWCLGIDGECNLVGTVPAANPLSKFRFVPVAPGSEWVAPLLSSVPTFDESVKLSEEDLMHFVREGFLHVPGAVDSALVDAALGAINATLCSPGGGAVVGEDGTMQYCPSLRGRAEIQSLLYRSKVWTIAQLLLGRDKVQRCEGGQIALRPPQVGQGAARHRAGGEGVSLPPRQWHIDGMGKGKHSPFSLLVGVSLSPQETDGCGNFVVFPGSHIVLLPLLKAQVEAGSGLFSDEGASNPSKPAFHNGFQVHARPGDAVFAHQKLAHRGGPNTSSGIRYQVYFRLRHVNHDAFVESAQVLDDLWVEFEGVRESEIVPPPY